MKQAGWMRTLPYIALLVLLCAGPAAAEELVGVPLYPGAVPDPAMTDHLEEVMAEEGAAYCTGDSPATVAEFYRKEGFSPAGEGAKGRVVYRRDVIEVTIQGPPRKDPASGKKREDTLILITRED